MENKDVKVLARTELAQAVSDAAKEGNTEAFTAALVKMCEGIESDMKSQAEALRGCTDSAILAQRGVRQLTAEESKFYKAFISAARVNNGNAMAALTNIEKVFPETTIDQIMDDMVQSHPLLDAVDTQNTTGLTKILANTDAGQGATWGAITDAVVTEIASGFKELDLGQNKLSAFIPISEDMLILGPSWLDNYIRTCLSEALAIGYENGIVTGTGKSMPIGMDRNVADDVTVTAGVYPQKDAIVATDFTPAAYGALIAPLAKTSTGKARVVSGLILICNPQDYFKTIMPATTLLTPEGQYVNNVLPYPTMIIQSVAVKQGEALLGIGKNYLLGIGGKRGVQFSDDYKFLEDQRFYKVVAYGNGRAKDNNSFLRLDISKLEPTYITVKQK